MGRSFVFNGIEITIPDAYSALDVSGLLRPSVSGVGIVGLVGHSNGGKQGVHIIPGGSANTVVRSELHSGSLANMAALSLRAGIDPDVPGGASTVLAVVTNDNLASSLPLGLNKGVDAVNTPSLTATSKQYGEHTNLFSIEHSIVLGSSFFVFRDDQGLPEEMPGVGLNSYMTFAYIGAGAAATCELIWETNRLRFKTTVDAVGDLDVDVTDLQIKQLASIVANNPDYQLVPNPLFQSTKMSDLDYLVTPQNILTALDFKAGVYEIVKFSQENSRLISLTRTEGNEGDRLPDAFDATNLSGGATGDTLNSDVQAAYDLLLELRVNATIPLFSDDAEGGTQVLIESVNSIVRDHVVARSSILGRSECQAFVSIKGNKDAFIAECRRMGSRYVACTSQSIRENDIFGTPTDFPNYAFSVVCAQTQVGSPIGTPLTSKTLPVSGISQDVSWSPTVDGVELIKNGALIAGPDENNQLRIIAGYTTHLSDDNDANINIEAVESLAIFSFNHRRFMKQKFVGKSAFGRDDVIRAIEDSVRAEKNASKSIKDFDLSGIELLSISPKELIYNVPVVPWLGTSFVLPTIVAIQG